MNILYQTDLDKYFNASCKLFRMEWDLRQRRQVIEDVPFLHKQCLEGLPVQFPLSYQVRVRFQGQDYTVMLDWVHKGKGHALMFRCPLTRRMVERLYPWAGMLVSRHVLRLSYASQIRGKLEVWEHRAQKLRHALRDPLISFPLFEGLALPRKPKAMRWASYWPKIEALRQIQQFQEMRRSISLPLREC